MKEEINLSKKEIIDLLFLEDANIKNIFNNASDLNELRENLFNYLNDLERSYFNIYSHKYSGKMHIIKRDIAKECIRVFKNIIRTENEEIIGFSALDSLFKIYNKDEQLINEVGNGFILEFLFLIKGMNGKVHLNGTEGLSSNEITAEIRCRILDGYSRQMLNHFKNFTKGTDEESIKNQKSVKNKILRYFSATDDDWKNYKWHLNHIIRDYKTLSELIKLEEDEIQGIKEAEKNGIPFQITPYYLTLFNENSRDKNDRLVRAQVIPSKEYCVNVVTNRTQNIDMDFMGEKSTSPVPGVTRRYPNIVILKPFDSCPQICVYCQRNWEIKSIQDTVTSSDKIEDAINWIKKNKYITEVLVTGGDPLTLDNEYIFSLLKKLHNIKHIERIRIGTRVLATLPFRIDTEFIKILRRFNKIGKKEICVITHFEDASEITPDVLDAVKKIKRAGINIYNQQVFTYFNSFKYKTCFLRKILKLSGIDPYYSFNTKGKEETRDFRVPIARIEQERKEEARLLPGIVRTDEPVFNVPKLGKSNLQSWQEHEIIMILQDGSRVYRFYPWEYMLLLVEDYLYTDVPIYTYLKRLENDGEDVEEYKSIWYYF